MIVANMLKICIAHKRKVKGNRSSIISISLEKRFIIRPIGVVSKNDIGDRSMLSNILLCKVDDAFTIRVRAKYPKAMIANPVKIKKTKRLIEESDAHICDKHKYYFAKFLFPIQTSFIVLVGTKLSLYDIDANRSSYVVVFRMSKY